MCAKWNLRDYEIFAHRGYLGTNTLESFERAVSRGFHIECDIVNSADGTVYIEHERYVTTTDGASVNVNTLTDAEFKTYFPDQPTAAEFIAWMQKHPDTLAVISAYQGLDTFIAQIATAGIDDRIMFDATTPSTEKVIRYPRVSWCVAVSSDQTDSDLDAYRTAQNIVSADECEDNSDGRFPVLRQWSDCTTSTLDSLIAKGVTWFTPSVNGSNLDAFAEALKAYAAPSYSQSYMLNQIGDAIREKNETDDSIAARNYPSQIRKLNTVVQTEPMSELKWMYDGTTASNITALKGYFPGVSRVTFDLGGNSLGVPNVTYCLLGETGCVVDYYGTQNATMGSDFFRQSGNVKEINFHDGIYPTSITRCFYQLNSVGIFSDVERYTGEVTVTGMYLDSLSGLYSFAGWTSQPLNIEWEGVLYNSVNFSTGTNLTKNSVNRIVERLADYSDGEAHTLTLGSTLLALVDADKIDGATAKNWTIV